MKNLESKISELILDELDDKISEYDSENICMSCIADAATASIMEQIVTPLQKENRRIEALLKLSYKSHEKWRRIAIKCNGRLAASTINKCKARISTKEIKNETD